MRRLFIALLLCGCGPAGGPGAGTLAVEGEQSTTLGNRTGPEQPKENQPATCVDPTLEALRTEVFLPSCGHCHGGDTPRADLDLTLELPELQARLMQPASQSASGMPLVTPGAPGASYLYLKVFLESPLIGAQMPKDGALDDCVIDAIRTYIDP